MKKHTMISLLLAAILTVSLCGAYAEGEVEPLSDVERAAILSTDPNNAYVIFDDPLQENMMTYVDGMEQGITDATDPLYSEYAEFNGIKSRKVYKENYVYLDIDESFYEEGDNEFMVAITYWDFGPDVGYFHFEYNSSDESLGEEGMKMKRISIMKTGLVQKWCTEKIYINDANFTGALDHNCDARLVTNAYNAFAKVEITNISAAKRGGKDVQVGTVNSVKAETLHKLGLYQGTSETEYVPSLDQKMTREELITAMVIALGWEDEALEEKMPCSFSDVDDAYKDYVGYAESLEIILGDGSGNFNASAEATKRDLLTFYARALGIEGENLYENIETIAAENQLIEDKDLIFNIDFPMTRDNFAGVAFNALLLTYRDGSSVLNSMVAEGMFTFEDVKATGNASLTAKAYEVPVKMPKSQVIDPTTGITINYINIDGGKAILPYVTQQRWTTDGKRFIIGSDKTQALYEYNIETEEIRMLDYASVGSGSAEAVVTPEDVMFYKKTATEIWKMDLNTYEKEKVATVPSYASGASTIQVTNDGKYLTCYWKESRSEEDFVGDVNRIRIIPRLDCETGEWDTSLHHEFNDDPRYPDVGHPIINPEYENLLFFCHEGTTEDIPDRLWIGDITTGETRNLFLQAERADGRTGEPSGHEVWSQDGEDMFFVKYTRDTNLGQSGIVRINKDGSGREYINGDYPYWHCYPSPDKKWVAADIQYGNNQTGVALINAQTYESYLLANFSQPSPNHPYQPHPVISYDGKKVSFQRADETGMLCAAWIDISEFVDGAQEGESGVISDTASYISYPGANSEVTKATQQGEECLRVGKEKALYVNLDDALASGTNSSVTFNLTYLDIGHQPMLIRYTSAVEDKSDYANREDMTMRIERNNTGKWITQEITLDNANLDNAGRHQTDVSISGLYSLAYVKSVDIVS